jgi:hypothetical protein
VGGYNTAQFTAKLRTGFEIAVAGALNIDAEDVVVARVSGAALVTTDERPEASAGGSHGGVHRRSAQPRRGGGAQQRHPGDERRFGRCGVHRAPAGRRQPQTTGVALASAPQQLPVPAASGAAKAARAAAAGLACALAANAM